jgi:hypothetical protein
MKTKKEILKWWWDRGEIIDNRKDSDWDSFWREVDRKELKIDIKETNSDDFGGVTALIISKRGWKFNLIIFFENKNEAYHIMY